MMFLLKETRIISALPNKKLYGQLMEVAARHGINPIIDKVSLDADRIQRSIEKLRRGAMVVCYV